MIYTTILNIPHTITVATVSGKKRKATDPVRKKKGGQVGAKKWSDRETMCLLDVIKVVLPLGAKGWGEITKHFNEVAKHEDTSEH